MKYNVKTKAEMSCGKTTGEKDLSMITVIM